MKTKKIKLKTNYVQKAHKIRFYPTQVQKNTLEQFFGNNRWYWNYLVDNFNKKENNIKSIKELKQKYDWLNKADAQIYANTKNDFISAKQKAFSNKVKIERNKAIVKANNIKDKKLRTKKLKKAFRLGMPKFKSKYDYSQSFRNCMISQKFIYLKKYQAGKKIGILKLSEQLRFEGKITNYTIEKSNSNKYYIVFLVETKHNTLSVKNKKIGIDVGIESFITTSDAIKIKNPKYLRDEKIQKKLKKYQKKLSHKILIAKNNNKELQTCKNIQKNRIKLARVHEKIQNQRTNYLQKLSSSIISENQVIIVEDLAVKNMVKNKHLSKSISDASWSNFISMLEYKAKWNDKQVIKIDKFFASSKTCSFCNKKVLKLPLYKRNWICPNCNKKLDRDYNASINILKQGLKELNHRNCGDSSVNTRTADKVCITLSLSSMLASQE
jgi:putative transposase